MIDLVASITTSMWVHDIVYRRRFKYLHLYSLVSSLYYMENGPAYCTACLGLYYLIENLIKNRKGIQVAMNRRFGYWKPVKGIWSMPILKHASHIPV